MLVNIILYTLIGYLSGSLLFSKLYSRLFHASDISINSWDHTYGVINAFKNGGLACGIFSLVGDMLKGFLPVYIYLHYASYGLSNIGLAMVMAAPVIGDNFSCLNGFKGGKGFFTSLGVLAGLLPETWQPLVVLIVLYGIFSYVLIINPVYYRSMVIYVLFLILSVFSYGNVYANFGCVLLSFSIVFRLIISTEYKSAFSLVPVWKQESHQEL